MTRALRFAGSGACPGVSQGGFSDAFAGKNPDGRVECVHIDVPDFAQGEISESGNVVPTNRAEHPSETAMEEDSSEVHLWTDLSSESSNQDGRVQENV